MRVGVVAIVAFLLPALTAADSVEGALERLRQAEELWRVAGPSAYTVTVDNGDDAPARCRKHTYRVRNNQSTLVVGSSCRSREHIYGTVPAMFAFIRKQLLGHIDEVTLDVDLNSGYPKKFFCRDRDNLDGFDVVDLTPETQDGP